MHFWPYNRKERQSTDKRELLDNSNTDVLSIISLPTPSQTGGMPLADALLIRRSIRVLEHGAISDQQLSNLLWAACGVSYKKETGKGTSYLYTNPTASNHQEVKVYVFREDGFFLYEPNKHSLLQLSKYDKRKKLSKLDFVKKATVSLCLVADLEKMVRHDNDPYRKQLYSAIDSGYVSQNIYLHCTANGLTTCACGIIDREKISEILKLTNAKVMLVHPIGINKKEDNV